MEKEQNKIYATNIEYSISKEDIKSQVEFLLNEYPEKLRFLLGKHYSNLENFSIEELADAIKRKIDKNSLKPSEFLGIDSFLKIPSTIGKDDFDTISNYISDATGFLINSYEITSM